MRKLRLLLGGSPCTHWSIAQKNNRETEPSGIGWELFLNYVIAWRSGQFDHFLYENNKSMAKPIRNQIDVEFNRTYAENANWELISSVEEDKGHTKRWIWRNKTTSKVEYITRILINSALVSAQNRQRYYWTNIPSVAQPTDRGILLKDILESGVDLSQNEKAYALTTRCQGVIPEDTIQKHRHSMVAEPIRIGTVESDSHTDHDSKQYRVYSPEGKSTTICGQGGGMGAKTGLYACPIGVTKEGKSFALTAYYSTGQNPEHTLKKSLGSMVAETWNGKTYPAYEVRNGLITIKDKQYPIKLPDGYYIIRKLTVKECMRLQTVRDDYIFPVSNTQAYKMLGNGWTVDVIAHILSHIPHLQDYELEVLSVYDGMSCGNLALEKLGCKIARYVSYEIDKWAIETTQANFPFVEQRGDAFQIREHDWKY